MDSRLCTRPTRSNQLSAHDLNAIRFPEPGLMWHRLDTRSRAFEEVAGRSDLFSIAPPSCGCTDCDPPPHTHLHVDESTLSRLQTVQSPDSAIRPGLSSCQGSAVAGQPRHRRGSPTRTPLARPCRCQAARRPAYVWHGPS